MKPATFLLSVICGSLGAFGILLVVVFATGSTFGQRCAALYEHGSQSWQMCVRDLATRRDQSWRNAKEEKAGG
jgi:hypothetical protein